MTRLGASDNRKEVKEHVNMCCCPFPSSPVPLPPCRVSAENLTEALYLPDLNPCGTLRLHAIDGLTPTFNPPSRYFPKLVPAESLTLFSITYARTCLHVSLILPLFPVKNLSHPSRPWVESLLKSFLTRETCLSTGTFVYNPPLKC